jgi:uncharacterized protein
MIIVLYLLVGLIIGLISGFLGIGGGAMLVPLFIYVFKMNMYQAVGTSLAVIAPISIIGAFSHHLKGAVNLEPVLLIALAAAVGIFISGQVIHLIPALILRRSFAVFLVLIAVKMFAR